MRATVRQAEHMRDFWDARAREDAFFFVDDRLAYGHPDVDRFWAQGAEDLGTVLAAAQVDPPAGDVVDVGCGLGRLSRALAQHAASVRAIDVSAEMLSRARELNAHLDNVSWVHGDGVTLQGIDDASADAVVSHVVFQHIPDPQVTLGYVRDMGRVLRPGGWAAFQISNDPSIHVARGGLRRRVAALLGRAPSGQDDARWLGSAVELDDLRAAAADGGLRVAHVTGEGTQYCVVRLERPA
jgi:SAM-dependent methyltransferase